MLQLDKIKLFFFKQPISMDLNNGEILGILGPSGAGKTTLLKSIKGFENKEGLVILDGKIISDKQDYNIGFVHQQPVIFNHWSVYENLICGNLYVKNQNIQAINQKLNKLIKMFNLEKLIHKNIKNLSVGEKQRLSIIRCLMMDPKVILMDEPSSSLDPINIKILCEVLQQLKKMGVILIITSHDLEFIKNISDKILFLHNKGEVLFNGKNEDFWKSDNAIIQHFIQ